MDVDADVNGYLLQLASYPQRKPRATLDPEATQNKAMFQLALFRPRSCFQNFKHQPDPRCVRHAPYPRLGFRTRSVQADWRNVVQAQPRISLPFAVFHSYFQLSKDRYMTDRQSNQI